MSTDWKSIEAKYYMQLVKRQPVVIVKGEGTRVWDDEGKEYLDFTSGWAVNNVGHANPVVAEAIAEQARTLLQTSNQFYTVPQLHLAEVLIENSCFDRIFIGNSGLEANEGAIKLARKYGSIHRNGAFEIITADDSFHGRSLTTMAASGNPAPEVFQPEVVGFKHIPYDDIDAVKEATTDRTAAVMLEPVQGEGGVNVPSPGYLKQVREWCDSHGLLLVFDEVQTGLGRLGTLFGYQAFDVEPDVMALAKGLGGGVPIGAFLAKEHAAVLGLKEHGSTFGGNALTCAAANASVRYIIDNDVAGNAARMGEIFKKRLKDLKAELNMITDVRGMGLLCALEFADEVSMEVVAACNDEGLLLNPVRPNAIRFMPPLTVTEDEIDEAMSRLSSGIAAATGAAA